MKRLNLSSFAVLFLFCVAPISLSRQLLANPSPTQPIHRTFAPVAVLELFTSQGCSSCPPADELLNHYMGREKESIFPLSFHVDYWNRLGWKDIFSESTFSERQEKYAGLFKLQSVYTPQMIVNGTSEYTGSNETSISKAVTKALSHGATVQIIAETLISEKTITCNYVLSGNYENNFLNIALVETKASVPVNAGENKGAVLNNYNVVRVWQVLGADIAKNKTVITRPADLPLKNAKLILFTQDKNTYLVTGAASLGF